MKEDRLKEIEEEAGNFMFFSDPCGRLSGHVQELITAYRELKQENERLRENEAVLNHKIQALIFLKKTTAVTKYVTGKPTDVEEHLYGDTSEQD